MQRERERDCIISVTNASYVYHLLFDFLTPWQRPRAATLGIHNRGVQSEGGAVDWGSNI